MDKSEAQRIIDRELGPLMYVLGIPHWLVSASADLTDDYTLGYCDVLVDYEKAHLRFNTTLFGDGDDAEDELVKTIRHELFHLVLAPYELYREGLEAIDMIEPIRPLLKRLWTHAEEQAVINLERMYVGLTSELAALKAEVAASKVAALKTKPKTKRGSSPSSSSTTTKLTK